MNTTHETRRESHQSVNTTRGQQRVLDALQGTDGLTADEIADKMGVHFMTTRPRCTELMKRKLIKTNGEKRDSAMGNKQAVFVLVKQQQLLPGVE